MHIGFSGDGATGSVTIIYGPGTDAKYPQAFVVTGANGMINDPTAGLSDATIVGLVPRNFAAPEPGNLLAPASFSTFAVASGLPMDNHGVLSYDNLFWPGGSPPTATGYDPHGGVLDIYGLMFDLGSGIVANLWSNGDAGSGVTYGLSIANSDTSLHRVDGTLLFAVPEPASAALLGAGLLGLLASRRRPALAAGVA